MKNKTRNYIIKSMYAVILCTIIVRISNPVMANSSKTHTQAAIDRMYELIEQGYSGDVIDDQLYEEFDHVNGPHKTGGIDGLLLDGTPAGSSTPSGTGGNNSEPAKPVHTHTWTDDETKKATCKETGEILYTCYGCGETYKEVTTITDHDYVAVKETAATCKAPASITFECTVCGDTVVEEKPGDPADHIYIATNDSVKPTCTESGHMHYVCSVCDDEYEEFPEALRHDWNTEYEVDTKAGCETKGKKSIHCTRCDEIQEGSELAIEAMGHDEKMPHEIREATFWEYGEEITRCKNCGEVINTLVLPATGNIRQLILPVTLLILIIAGIGVGTVLVIKRRRQ